MIDHNARRVPIDSVKLFKGNARIGNVDVIRESLRINGQYRPIVVREQTKEILAGNHTWKAAKAEGWTEIWATFIKCDAKQAKRINLVDNRAPEMGEYDQQALVNLMSSLPSLEGTGFTHGDLSDLTKGLGQAPNLSDLTPGPADVPDDDYESQHGVIVLCEDQEQQRRVYDALQRLTQAKSTEFSGAQLRIVAV